MGRAAGRIGVADAGSVKTLGIALREGNDGGFVSTSTLGSGGRQGSIGVSSPESVPVACGGIRTSARFASGAAFGDRLKAAAQGAVTPMAAGDDFRLCVGKCVDPHGVSAGTLGLVETV